MPGPLRCERAGNVRRATAPPWRPRTEPTPLRDVASSAGPVLGRSVVVRPGQVPPSPWERCDRAGDAVEELEQAWLERTPLVIQVDDEPIDDEVELRPVWSLSPSFAFPGERRAHATFANAVDARGGTGRWQLAEEAVRLGATSLGPADVVLPDGTPAFCDGGPLEWRHTFEGAVVVPRLALLAGSLVSFGANDTEAELAPDQRSAVLHPGGAARIIAPAGSGKTRVLTERARHLLRQWRLPGRAVTLLAFNKRAADEMHERTPDLPELQVRTLNALGLSLLMKSDAVTTIQERDVRALLDTLVDLPRRANTDPAAAWIEALSAIRLGLRSPAEVEAEFDGDVDGLPEVFARYRQLLADRCLVDFDEQVYRAIEKLLIDPAARSRARSSCRMLLVDEFQDLTPAHLLLIRLLAGPEGAVFGVGDDDQTIYGYSGASPQWLIDYQHFFPAAGDHPLEVNYRCPVPVVNAARTLLTHNRRRVPKRMVAAPGRRQDGDELQVMDGGDPLATTVAVVSDLVSGGAPPHHVAVLTRVNVSLAPVQVALVHRHIPVQPAVDVSYLSRGGIQAALAWLRLAVSVPGGLVGSDVAQAARRPSRALSPNVVEWMSEQSDIDGLERLARRLKPRDADKILGFSSDLETVRRLASSATTADVLRAVRDEVGLDQAMEVLETARRRLDRSAQTDDLDVLGGPGRPPRRTRWLRGMAPAVAATSRLGRRGGAVQHSPGEGAGMAPCGAPRCIGRPPPPPLGRRCRGGTPGLPRRTDAWFVVGACRGRYSPLSVPGRVGRSVDPDPASAPRAAVPCHVPADEDVGPRRRSATNEIAAPAQGRQRGGGGNRLGIRARRPSSRGGGTRRRRCRGDRGTSQAPGALRRTRGRGGTSGSPRARTSVGRGRRADAPGSAGMALQASLEGGETPFPVPPRPDARGPGAVHAVEHDDTGAGQRDRSGQARVLRRRVAGHRGGRPRGRLNDHHIRAGLSTAAGRQWLRSHPHRPDRTAQ